MPIRSNIIRTVCASTTAVAQDETGRKPDNKGFVDLNSDGINDNAVDSDGDDIPNGQDSDFVKPQDGSGQQNRKGNTNKGTFKNQNRNKNGNGSFGPGDGTGPKGNCGGSGGK